MPEKMHERLDKKLGNKKPHGMSRRELSIAAGSLVLGALGLSPKGNAAERRQTGTIHKSYRFDEAASDLPYRLYVPARWDGRSDLPAVIFLHGAWNDENQYVEANNGQMEKLAEQYGYLLISPLGYSKLGAYGSAMSLSSMFGDLGGQAKARATVEADAARSRELKLSEGDVLNVLERTLDEYPVDRKAIFLAGHSMGAGGTWYLGNKYSARWAAIAPMSGPFIDQGDHGLDNLKTMPIFYSEGLQTPSLKASRLLNESLKGGDFDIRYREYDADHGGMVPLALPDVFAFFDDRRRVA